MSGFIYPAGNERRKSREPVKKSSCENANVGFRKPKARCVDALAGNAVTI